MNVAAKLARHKIARNTSALMIGQMVGRVLTVVYVAALARYVGSEGIGQISIANTLNGLLVLLVAPGLEVLLTRDVAADREKAATYLSNTLVLRGIFSLPFLLAVLAVSYTAGYTQETIWIVYVYAGVYLLDIISALIASTFQAYEHMEYVGGAEVFRNIINVVLSLIGIYLGWSLFAIALMSLVASLFKFGFLFSMLQLRFVRPTISINGKLARQLIISSIPFGMLMILHTGQAQFGTFIISLFYPEESVGLYASANTLIIMLLMLPSAFAKAIFPTFSHLYTHARDELVRFYGVCYKYLLVLGFPLGLGTILVGEHIIPLVYGDGFDGAIPFLYILALFLFTIVGYSNGSLLNATGQQNFFAWTEGVAVGVNVIGSLILVPLIGPIGSAIAFVASGVGTFFVHSRASHQSLGISIPWMTILRVALATALMGVVVVIALQFGVPWLAVALGVGPLAYSLALLGLGLLRWDELKLLSSARNA